MIYSLRRCVQRLRGADDEIATASFVIRLWVRYAAAFKKAIAARQIAYAGSGPCPADLLCASGSGLDPDISVAAARYQARRVAKARGLSQTQIHALIDSCIIKPQLGILGEPRINILSLNMALDHESKR